METRTLVETWYDDHAKNEALRLDDGRLEMAVTLRQIDECIKNMSVKKAQILDIGGGPGRYCKTL